MIPSIISLVGGIIDKIFPNADDAAKAKLELMKLQQQGELEQLAVNKVEAANINVFVSGWRPFIGWCCGAVFAYTYILQPLITMIVIYSGHAAPPLPELDTGAIMSVLLGMLGLGGLRTVEKIKGVAGK